MTTLTAAPCKLCQTVAGYVHPRTGEPTRTRHLCEACYIRERRGGRLDRWPRSPRPANPATHTCAWCWATFQDHPSTPRIYCSRQCYDEKQRSNFPTIPTAIVPATEFGWPDQPALTLTTWPMDLLCARYDAPRWETVAWNWCPRDPGFAAYHDADTAQQAAA